MPGAGAVLPVCRLRLPLVLAVVLAVCRAVSLARGIRLLRMRGRLSQREFPRLQYVTSMGRHRSLRGVGVPIA